MMKYFVVLLLMTVTVVEAIPKSCPNINFNEIPSTHLYHSKRKPIIVAHRGTPKVFLENTLEGFRKTIDVKADGYEVDIFKTKDDQLVAFHDDSTKRLSGVDKIVTESTYEELNRLNLTANITTGGKTILYEKVSKIPLLKDILEAMRDTGLIHFLELKPSAVYNDDDSLSQVTGTMVAELVTKMNLADQVIIISFDYRKLHAVKQRNDNLTTGSLFSEKFIQIPKAGYKFKRQFPNLTQCIDDAPASTEGFFSFVLESGVFFKASGSSCFMSSISMYDNKLYMNNTIAKLSELYRPDIELGFFTAYSIFQTEKENLALEGKLKDIAERGGDVIVTDDVPRVRALLQPFRNSAVRCFVTSFLMGFSILMAYTVTG